MRPHAVKHRRGFTLIECVIALGVLFVGGYATAQLVNVLGSSTSRVDATTEAVGYANMVLAQINDARFFSPTDLDPGLTVGTHATPAGGAIDAVGTFPAVNPTMSVVYEVVACARCTDPFSNGQVALGGVEVIVTIDNVPPHERLRGPMRFFTRKEFAPSNTDPALIRGW